MEPITRRDALRLVPAAGLLLGAGVAPRQDSPDRKSVLAAGMTEAEADCWAAANAFAGAFLALPDPDEGHERAHTIHVLQKSLLMRPAYRAYLAAAGGAGRKVEAGTELDGYARPVDRDRAIRSGLTEAEADCWTLMVAYAVAYRDLPKLHPMENHEVAHALHHLRSELLARPFQRR